MSKKISIPISGILAFLRILEEYASPENEGKKFPDFWFGLQKSITEDALKLVLEAIDEKIMLAKQKEVLDLIKKFDR